MNTWKEPGAHRWDTRTLGIIILKWVSKKEAGNVYIDFVKI
jgi:hypothetical protein